MSYWKYVKDSDFFNGMKQCSRDMTIILFPFVTLSILGGYLAKMDDSANMNVAWLWLIPLGLLVTCFWASYCNYKGWILK